MSTTKQLARTEWETYFDRFTRERLQSEAPGAATIEVVSPTLGDQLQVSAARLLGLTYDPKSEALEVLLENIDHLIFRPTEIWVVEAEPGFISTLEIIQSDGTKELIYFRRSGPVAGRSEAPAQA
jgi:hypothetical protein